VDEEADPVALERAVAEKGRRASKALYRETLKVLDARATGRQPGPSSAWSAGGWPPRSAVPESGATRVGAGGHEFHPLDRALGLSQAEASPALREAICELATRLPYRQVEIEARLTSPGLDPIRWTPPGSWGCSAPGRSPHWEGEPDLRTRRSSRLRPFVRLASPARG